VLLLPCDRPREDLVALIVDVLRRRGLRVACGTGWEDFDATLGASGLLSGRLVTSAHPEGAVQLRVRRALRTRRAAAAVFAMAALAVVAPPVAVALAIVLAADMVRGAWRSGPLVRRIVAEATA
jgi:hypothetical protein